MPTVFHWSPAPGRGFLCGRDTRQVQSPGATSPDLADVWGLSRLPSWLDAHNNFFDPFTQRHHLFGVLKQLPIMVARRRPGRNFGR